MGLENVQLNFKTINLVPYNPEKIINGLDFKFHTFTLPNFHLMNFVFINSNVLHTAEYVVQNFVNLRLKLLCIGIIHLIIYIDWLICRLKIFLN